LAILLNRCSEIYNPCWISEGLSIAVLELLKKRKGFMRLFKMDRKRLKRIARGLTVSFPKAKDSVSRLLKLEMFVSEVILDSALVRVKLSFSVDGTQASLKILYIRLFSDLKLDNEGFFVNSHEGFVATVSLKEFGNEQWPIEIPPFSQNGKAAKAFCTAAEFRLSGKIKAS